MSSKSTQIGKLAIKNNVTYILPTSPTALTKFRIAASKRENSAPQRDLSTIGLNFAYRLLGGRRSKVGIKRSKTSQSRTQTQSVRNLNNSSRSATTFRCKLSVRQMSDLAGQSKKLVMETAGKPFNRHLYDAAMNIFNPKLTVHKNKAMEKSFVYSTAITIRDDLMPLDKDTLNLISVKRSQSLTRSENQDGQGAGLAESRRDPLVDKELWSSRYQEYKPRMANNWDTGNRIIEMNAGGRVNLNESSFENAKNIYNASTATRLVSALSTMDRPRIPTCINHRINELLNKQHKQDALTQRLSGACNTDSGTKESAPDGNTKKQILQQFKSGADAVGGDNGTKTPQKLRVSTENRKDKNAIIDLAASKATFMRVHTQTVARAQQQNQLESNVTWPRLDNIHYDNRLQPVTETANRLVAKHFDENEKGDGATSEEQAMPAAATTSTTHVNETKDKTSKRRKLLLPLTEVNTMQQQQQQQQHQPKISRDMPSPSLEVNRVQQIVREPIHRMPVPNMRKHVNAQTAKISVQSRKQSTKPNLKQSESQLTVVSKNRNDQKQTKGSTVENSDRALKSELRAKEDETIVRSKSYSSISGVHQILSKPQESRVSHVMHMRDRKVW